MGKSSTLLTAAIAAVIAASVPSLAAAEPIVPPGNSAAAQYTEAFPTAGGEHALGGSGHGSKRTPARVLGPRNARRLETAGPEGRAAAALATATAPAGAGPGAGGGGAVGEKGVGAPGAKPAAVGPHDSSGFEEVIGRATGSSSSSGIGLWLPLAIVAVLLWSVGYLWRQRRRVV